METVKFKWDGSEYKCSKSGDMSGEYVNVNFLSTGKQMQSDSEEFFCMIKGKKEWDNEKLLAYLLKEELVFCNSRKHLCLDGTEQSYITVIFALCNDVFAWGYAEAEPIEPKEFSSFYELHKENKKWGAMKWACKKRNLQPQKPIVDDMKKDGYWDDELESLEKNKN